MNFRPLYPLNIRDYVILYMLILFIDGFVHDNVKGTTYADYAITFNLVALFGSLLFFPQPKSPTPEQEIGFILAIFFATPLALVGGLGLSRLLF